jgi:hypothetical protein
LSMILWSATPKVNTGVFEQQEYFVDPITPFSWSNPHFLLESAVISEIYVDRNNSKFDLSAEIAPNIV